MACLDAAGKALDRSVASLLGGAVRDGVDVASYLFYRYASEDGRLPAVDSAEAILDRANELVERNGHRSHKLKGGVLSPVEEYRALKLLRDRFPDDPLVWDPNAAWSVETTIRVGRRLTADAFELQWLEDPCPWLEGMSQARATTGIPFATNMCLIGPEQLAPGIRARSVDVILADVHYWGGFRANQKMAAVVEAFNLGLGMHSDRELGISTAAMVHLACSIPNLTYPIDSHYHDQADDIITKPWVYRAGRSTCPRAPASGSSSIATSSTSTIAISSTTSRSTSSTTRIDRAGSRPSRSSDPALRWRLGGSGWRPSTCSTTRRATAGRSVVRSSRRSSARSLPTSSGCRKSTGPSARTTRWRPRRVPSSTTACSARPRPSVAGTPAIGTASCSSSVRGAQRCPSTRSAG